MAASLTVRRAMCGLAFLVSAFGSPAASASEPKPTLLPKPTLEPPVDPNHSPYRVHFLVDTGISTGAMVLIGLPRLFSSETIRPWCGLDCDPKDVNAFDRTAIGKSSEVALQVSNAGFFASISAPFVFSLLDTLTSDPSDGFLGYAKDTVIYIETLSLTLATNNLLSYVVRRPRPHTYNTELKDSERLDPNNAFSFPSGHTSASFAMATAFSMTYTLRHPDSPMIAPIWIGTLAAATTTGVLRPLAGDHFWSDVIVGAVTGVGLGLLIPWIHMEDKTQHGKLLAFTDPASWRFRLMPVPIEQGAGLMISVQ